jgi:acyl-CoA reductase-like NAD-dependent aldehyde dehydrogenase
VRVHTHSGQFIRVGRRAGFKGATAAVFGPLKERSPGDCPVASVARGFTLRNFPSDLIARKVATAVAAGAVNPVVATTAACTPLMASKAVRKVSLKGSIRVGQQIIRDAVATLRKVSMETGGKAPVIVMDDADFGPIPAIARFSGEDDVLARANACDMGLSAYAFTRDPARARRAVAALKAGMVGINSFAMASSEAPFGGTNHLGMGRDGGTEGIRDCPDVISGQVVWA